jgi:hypothetical protein
MEAHVQTAISDMMTFVTRSVISSWLHSWLQKTIYSLSVISCQWQPMLTYNLFETLCWLKVTYQERWCLCPLGFWHLKRNFLVFLKLRKHLVYLLEHPTQKEFIFQSVYHTPKSTLDAQVNTSTHNLQALTQESNIKKLLSLAENSHLQHR